ncbi:MAG TPA: AzlD domain-containing protein [Propylenella sp.]|nr:AzlD domain-containing protein [Propylenella sp.]
MTLTFDSLDAPWWPYLFILIAGTLATEIWRWIGLVAGGRLRQDSETLIWVKAVATALVAGVVGQLIVFPSGELAATPVGLRIAAAALGWIAYWVVRKSVLVGVLTAEAVLLAGWLPL